MTVPTRSNVPALPLAPLQVPVRDPRPPPAIWKPSITPAPAGRLSCPAGQPNEAPAVAPVIGGVTKVPRVQAVPAVKLPSGYRRFTVEQLEEIKKQIGMGKAAA